MRSHNSTLDPSVRYTIERADLTTCQFRKLQDYRGGVGASLLANLARESNQAVTTRSLREQARSYPRQASQPPTDQPLLTFVGEVMRN
jgi:hypothetical protein